MYLANLEASKGEKLYDFGAFEEKPTVLDRSGVEPTSSLDDEYLSRSPI